MISCKINVITDLPICHLVLREIKPIVTTYFAFEIENYSYLTNRKLDCVEETWLNRAVLQNGIDDRDGCCQVNCGHSEGKRSCGRTYVSKILFVLHSISR